ncbi:NADH dehydrogenase [Amaricoccus macauensis]|jgi:NADH dehydrogenase|uniref:NADH dehydrogenase n=1 Tax=Amaricoccus macauensis TaxID=57001 RepID=A0A840SU88_9RHOB|nr:ETC complex I subunit [Amaricoccus macauensis]MBB5222731.1 NADH dehydrogenase [Amaricoccus macauensis]
MLAKIYQPAKSAMQSGVGKTRTWVLEFVPASARWIDPLMGWTGSGDMDSQVTLRFPTREEAVEYAERYGIPFELFEPNKRVPVVRPNGYGDNFAYFRRTAWTH